jgi:hypothetical protein
VPSPPGPAAAEHSDAIAAATFPRARLPAARALHGGSIGSPSIECGVCHECNKSTKRSPLMGTHVDNPGEALLLLQNKPSPVRN